MDYFAENDLQQLTVPDAGACCSACKEDASCVAWTYVEGWKVNCYTKGSGGFGVRTNCTECTSGVVLRDTGATCSGAIGVNFFADQDLTAVSVPAADACCQHCNDNADCTAWTFVNKDWQINCYTKGLGSGTYEVDEKDEDYISGIVDRTCTGIQGVDYFTDEDIAQLAVADAGECCNACKEDTDCLGWTFVQGWSVNCYKKGSGQWEVRTNCSDCTSGIVTRSTGATCFGQSNTTYVASKDLTAVYASSAGECCQHCNNNVDCTAWTFVDKNWQINCYTKGSGGYEVQEDVDEDFVSGVPDVRSNTVKGVDYFAEKDLAQLMVADADTCYAACRLDGSCLGWTFVDGWAVNCYTKGSGHWGVSTNCSDCISGVVLRTTVATCSGEAGKDYRAAQDLTSVFTQTAADCCQHCTNNDDCVAWTFVDKDWQINCYTKGSGDYEVVDVGKDYISGVVNRTCYGSPGVDYMTTTDLAQLTVGTSAQCCGACKQNSSCLGWTFVDGWAVNCYLKESGPWETRTNCTECTSGIVARDNGVVCSGETGKDFFADEDLTAVYVPDAGSCCKHCNDNSDCVAWTFVDKDWQINCYTKGSGDYGVRDGDDSYISGVVDRSITGRKGVDYPTKQDVAQLTVNSYEGVL